MSKEQVNVKMKAVQGEAVCLGGHVKFKGGGG